MDAYSYHARIKKALKLGLFLEESEVHQYLTVAAQVNESHKFIQACAGLGNQALGFALGFIEKHMTDYSEATYKNVGNGTHSLTFNHTGEGGVIAGFTFKISCTRFELYKHSSVFGQQSTNLINDYNF